MLAVEHYTRIKLELSSRFELLTPDYKTGVFPTKLQEQKSARLLWDSNPHHPDWKPGILTIKLSTHIWYLVLDSNQHNPLCKSGR